MKAISAINYVAKITKNGTPGTCCWFLVSAAIKENSGESIIIKFPVFFKEGTAQRSVKRAGQECYVNGTYNHL